MDLSKTYDCLSHDLIIAELAKVQVEVSQGSALEPMVFSIFIIDLCAFTLGSEICICAKDNTIFSCGRDVSEVAMYI